MSPAAKETRAPERPSRANADANAVDMHAAHRRDVAAPLAALRASMEALSAGLDAENPLGMTLDAAALEIVRVGRSVQTLVDFAAPPELRPLTCTLQEVIASAQVRLAPTCSDRLFLAIEFGRAELCIDVAVLVRCLGSLLETSLNTRDEVLLYAFADEEEVSIMLLAQAHATLAESRTSLLLQLAEREIGRMGGTFIRTALPSRLTRIELRLPRKAQDEG